MGNIIINGKTFPSVKVGSTEYNALMGKWAAESFEEEIGRDYESYCEGRDSNGVKGVIKA